MENDKEKLKNPKLELIRLSISQDVKDQVDETIKALDRAYNLGISDFKASLREEIKEKIASLKVYGNIPNGWKAGGYREILQLIDTVKHKTKLSSQSEQSNK